MSERFRNGCLALGLIVGGCIAIFAIVWMIGLNYCPNQPCDHPAYYQYVPSETPSDSEWNVPNPFRRTFESNIEPEFAEGYPKRHEYYDLRAQERMAHATDWIALLTLVSGSISAIGIGLIIWTLYVTRELSRNETRAYVQADRVFFFWGGKRRERPRVEVWFTNSGTTPAKSYRYRMRAFTYGHDEVGEDFPSIDEIGLPNEYEGPWKGMQPGGDGKKVTFSLQDMSEEIGEAVLYPTSRPKRGFAVYGEIEYIIFLMRCLLVSFSWGGADCQITRLTTRSMKISGA